MAQRVGIYYTSKYGQTRKIALRMQETFVRSGWEAAALDIDVKEEAAIPMTEFDLILIGGALYQKAYSKQLRSFVNTHLYELRKLPSAFFTVCMTVAAGTERSMNQAMAVVRVFLEQAHWRPSTLGVFAGALNYRKYPLLLRMIMKRITKKEGGPTDTSHDYEFTEWSEVERFATRLAQDYLLSPAIAVKAAQTS